VKARDEGAAGMHEIALALVQAATSAETRQRAPLATAFVRESLMRQDPLGYARSCEALADAQPAAVDGSRCRPCWSPATRMASRRRRRCGRWPSGCGAPASRF
jgi:hypothetical protein